MRQNNSVEICDEFEEMKKKDEVMEVHGMDIPAYSLELPGSQGVKPQELPA